MKEAELLALMRLQALPYIGDVSAKKLLQKFGSAVDIFHGSRSDLLSINGLGERRIAQFFDKRYLKEAEEELKFIQK